MEIARERLFTINSTILHKAVFHCLPYTHPPHYKFLGGYLHVCLSVCLPACLPACVSACLRVYLYYVVAWTDNRYIAMLYVYLYTFFIDLAFIFGPFTSSFVFCLLCFKFCLQKGFFPLLSFAFCVLTFSLLLLSFVFKLLYIVFWFWVFAC